MARRHRFAANAAHELRTPLAGLRAELEEARLHPGQTDLPRLLDSALRGVERLEAITADFCLLTQVPDGTSARHEPVDLSATARAHAVTPATGPDIRLRAAAPVIVNAVLTLLDRLVANLDSARCRSRGGTGLSLAIAHVHNGTLHVEHATGAGARFVLGLPLA